MPFSHSSTGICPLRSSGLGNGCSVIVSVGLPSFQHWRARVVPVTMSSSGSGPPVASAQSPLLKRAMVPCRSLVLPSLFTIWIFGSLVCRGRRVGWHAAKRRRLRHSRVGNFLNAQGAQAARPKQVFQTAPQGVDRLDPLLWLEVQNELTGLRLGALF